MTHTTMKFITGKTMVKIWYDPDGWSEHARDVGECDDLYSTYVEARKRMNDLHFTHRFYPIAALLPTGPT